MSTKTLITFLLAAALYFGAIGIASSSTGCQINGENGIYTNPTGNMKYTFVINGPYPEYNAFLTNAAGSCPRAQVYGGSLGYCMVDYFRRGTLRNYERLEAPLGCDLDVWAEILVSLFSLYTCIQLSGKAKSWSSLFRFYA